MKHFLYSVLFLFIPLASFPQQAVELKQVPMSRWNIGTAHYSGIAPIGEGRYAVVSDKEPADGFFVFRIDQNATTGEIVSIYLEDFKGNPSPKLNAQGQSVRDCEGVAFCPETKSVFISGEGDQRILEYTLEGKLTGRELRVPACFDLPCIHPNLGFEALSYSSGNNLFWTTSESTLKTDGKAASPQHPGVQNLLRLQSFDLNLNPVAQYAYRMDRGKTEDFGITYALGVPALCALPDGKLLVMEREVDVSNGYLSSETRTKIYLVNPTQGWPIDSSISFEVLDPNKFLIKTLVAAFTTRLTPFKKNFANYEGLCLGATLADGRQTVLLISDSQAGFGKGPIHLNDYVKVLIL